MTDVLNILAMGWMPEQRSTYAPYVDWTFYFVYWISVFFTLLITGLIIFFAIRNWDGGKRGAQHGRGGRGALGKGPTHNTALEMTWTIIPLLLVIAIFVFGFRGFLRVVEPKDDPYEITVIARQWSWSFLYPNNFQSNELHVPAGRPVEVTLTAQTVLHSFFVPEFRVKRDAVPGRRNKAWFQPVWSQDDAEPISVTIPPAEEGGEETVETFEVNKYTLYCAEYCGQQHSAMLATVVVHRNEESLKRWLDAQEKGITPLKLGEKIITQTGGCLTCHSVDGSTRIGPTFKNLWGYEETLSNGERVMVDEEYVIRSIEQPQAQIVDGFEGGQQMNPFTGFTERDYQAIFTYLNSISDRGEPLESEQEGEESEDGSSETQPSATQSESETTQPQTQGSDANSEQ